MIWRVTTRREFEDLRRGRRRRSGPLTVTVGSDEAPHPKVAYALGRRVGNAPRRNRLRRQLRAIMAAEGDRLTPTTYLISAGPAAVGTPYANLATYLRSALDDLGVRQGAPGR